MPQQRMTRDEFRRRARAQPKGRHERVGGEPVPMAPERVAHIQIKNRVWQTLDPPGIAVAVEDFYADLPP
jgi:hypothetical protein